ncbi:MAG TPA: aminopeptidase P family protein [Candidatus Merdenecus merdavium]|nr:aminopeptidase P family protein [Candidatus Merdenecus merdavium]
MRLDRLSKLMKEKQLDAVVITDGFNMNYFSGFSGATGYIYISDKRKVILTDSRYTTQAKQESTFETQEVAADRNYVGLLKELMKQDQALKIGFEDQHLKYAQVVDLFKGCEEQEWIALGGDLSLLRCIKDTTEIEKLKIAESIGDKAFTRILDVIKPGMTEIEVAAELEYSMKMNGAQGLSFDSIVASGVNSAMPHATPSNKKIEVGDFVTMDFGCMYQGYCSDMTRTIVIGKASEKQKEIYHVVLEAQLAAIDAARPGLTGAQVDKVARDIIAKAGYGHYFGHGLGHSVGLEIHEDPRFSPTCDVVMEENVIETVEPGIYIPDFGGVRIEDMILLTKDGCENFTHSRKDLIEL